MFPLRAQSAFNPDAPTLSIDDITKFRTDDALKSPLLDSLAVMLNFYALEMKEVNSALRVCCSATFPERREVWLSPSNHNFLRISRILACLTLLGCPRHAEALCFSCFERAAECVCPTSNASHNKHYVHWLTYGHSGDML